MLLTLLKQHTSKYCKISSSRIAKKAIKFKVKTANAVVISLKTKIKLQAPKRTIMSLITFFVY